MALIQCPECQRDVSDTLETCPHCGYQLSNSKEYPDSNPEPAAPDEHAETDNLPNMEPKKSTRGRAPSKKLLLIITAIALVSVAGCLAFMSYMQSLLPINQLSKLSAAQDYDAMAQLLADHSDDSELEASIQAIFDTSVQSVLSDFGNDQITKEEAQQRLDRLSVLGSVSKFKSELTKIDRSRTAHGKAESYFSIDDYQNAYSFYQQVC